MIKINKMFFDQPKVRSTMDSRVRHAFVRLGAFTRMVAKRSIRTRKKPSSPGSPPHSHIGWLKKKIFFGYDARRKSVVIGPTLFGPRKTADGAPVQNKTVPEVLEYGGRVVLLEYQRAYTASGRRQVIALGRDPDAWHRLGKKRLWHKKGQPLRIRAKRRREINIAARPYMAPAFAKAKAEFSKPGAELPKLWSQSVK